MCQMSMGEEIHHLQPQQHADKDGYIGNFHKNHVANLMSICATCHDKIHTHDRDCDRGHVEDSVMVRKKTTKGKYVLTKTTTTKPSNYAKWPTRLLVVSPVGLLRNFIGSTTSTLYIACGSRRSQPWTIEDRPWAFDAIYCVCRTWGVTIKIAPAKMEPLYSEQMHKISFGNPIISMQSSFELIKINSTKSHYLNSTE